MLRFTVKALSHSTIFLATFKAILLLRDVSHPKNTVEKCNEDAYSILLLGRVELRWKLQENYPVVFSKNDHK